MKNENTPNLACAFIGIIGLIAGIAAAKYQEKCYREEMEKLEKENKSRRDYIDSLSITTERFRSEVDEMSALADEVLAYIEESEKDLDDEGEL